MFCKTLKNRNVVVLWIKIFKIYEKNITLMNK